MYPGLGFLWKDDTMAISLAKGQTVSLEKSGAGLKRLHFGLGWDPLKKKGWFGFGRGSEEIDLDASCIVLDDDKEPIDLVWFQQLSSEDGSIVHTGDNLTGAGEGDDEVIKVDLEGLPVNAAHLVFTVNSFRGQTFDEVENAFCRVVDDISGSEICRYTLSEKGQHTGVLMGVASKNGSVWSFKAIGEASGGRTVGDMIPIARRHL